MFSGFVDGALSYLRAVKIISNYRLWAYVLAPALISLVLGVLIFRAAWGWSDNIGDWITSIYPFDWGRKTIDKIADIFGGLLIAAFGLIIFKQLVMALASPFMSFLSEAIEKKKLGLSAGSFSFSGMMSDLVRGIRISLRNIVRELLFTILLLLLGLIPLFSPFVAIAIFMVQAYYAGFGNMDFTLERYYNVRNSVHFVRKNRALALGNGTVFMLLLLTGIGFLIALPLGTVAAADETLKRLPR